MFTLAERDRAKKDAVEIAQRLIQFDTSNYGASAETKSTREIAEYVVDLLKDVDLDPQLIETAPGYWNVVTRWHSDNPERPGMVWHGHLDVVPEGKGWTVPAFDGRISDDGYLYGRGAVDMKSQNASMLAAVRMWARAGKRPPRDVVLSFFADEEAGGGKGARPLVERYPELFDNCDVVIGGEVGGFTFRPPGLAQDNWTISYQERGMWWWRAVANAEQGHGSFHYDQHAGNDIVDFLAAVRQQNPNIPELSAGAHSSLDALAVALDKPFDAKRADDFIHANLGAMTKWLRTSIRNTANYNQFAGGIKPNISPAEVSISVDSRFKPGSKFVSNVRALAQEFHIRVEDIAGPFPPWHSADNRPEIDAMTAAVLRHNESATFSLFRNPAGTDAKAFQDLLGRPIDTYGFGPLRLPPSEPFPDLFHGANERVPVNSLQDSVEILSTFLEFSGGVSPEPGAGLARPRIGVFRSHRFLSSRHVVLAS